jgi:branched-chain amino acid transport system permease protein
MTLLVTMLVVGGLGTVMGPVVGTVIMAFVQARLQSWPDARLIVLGLILLVTIVAVPRGIVALAGEVPEASRRLDRRGRRRRRGSRDATTRRLVPAQHVRA